MRTGWGQLQRLKPRSGSGGWGHTWSGSPPCGHGGPAPSAGGSGLTSYLNPGQPLHTQRLPSPIFTIGAAVPAAPTQGCHEKHMVGEGAYLSIRNKVYPQEVQFPLQKSQTLLFLAL